MSRRQYKNMSQNGIFNDHIVDKLSSCGYCTQWLHWYGVNYLTPSDCLLKYFYHWYCRTVTLTYSFFAASSTEMSCYLRNGDGQRQRPYQCQHYPGASEGSSHVQRIANGEEAFDGCGGQGEHGHGHGRVLPNKENKHLNVCTWKWDHICF